ncbi:MAG TPA: hypothetical protein VFH13_06455 [Gemmatimonadaceae bacterium]|nr:hypothetical protein [Gemmatimonadaceae bacterium]
MPQKPQHPFVPHRTPETARPIITAPEFRLHRPFLPGSERPTLEPAAFVDSTGAAQGQSELNAPLRSIGDFLEASPAALSAYSPTASENFYASELEEEPDELPPVEHFLDPLPAVDQFAPDAEGRPSDGWPSAIGESASTGAPPPDPSESGWVETDWQRYDWRSAAALGETPGDEASTAWATTDWDATTHRAPKPRQSAANAIATALDEIARRIREGDLSHSGPGPMTDSATIAATLAALLGVRR